MSHDVSSYIFWTMYSLLEISLCFIANSIVEFNFRQTFIRREIYCSFFDIVRSFSFWWLFTICFSTRKRPTFKRFQFSTIQMVYYYYHYHYFVFFWDSLTIQFRLFSNLLYRQGWSSVCNDPPISVFGALGL